MQKECEGVKVHLDKRWVAGFLGFGLLLSAVRFGQQRVKYTKFVYCAYLALKKDATGFGLPLCWRGNYGVALR